MRRRLLAMAVLAATSPSVALSPAQVVPGAYILELSQSADVGAFLHAVQAQTSARIRRQLDHRDFKGLSIELNGLKNIEKVAAMPFVEKVWPVEMVRANNAGLRREPLASGQHPMGRPFGDDEGQRSPERRDTKNWAADAHAPHVLKQVDRLRRKGLTGKGIRVAILDSGVDYEHPALGGCFGPGCLVTFGADLVKEEPTPRACDEQGTLLAGVIAAQPNPLGFTGIAPEVEIGMYRMVCDDAFMTDDLVHAIYQAVEDEARIILWAGGVPDSWPSTVLLEARSRVMARGVALVQSAGDCGSSGPFSLSNYASGSGFIIVGSADSGVEVDLEYEKNYTVLAKPKPGGIAGTVSPESSWGPTWDLDLQPALIAPGSDILTTALRDITVQDIDSTAYAVGGGADFSAALVAGIVALILEARPSLDPATVHGLLVTHSVPQRFHDGEAVLPYLAPVAQQGGGLVRAYDAAYATTTIEPMGLSFNDSVHRISSHTFTLSNTANNSVEYRIFHLPAVTVYTLKSDGSRALFPGVADRVQSAATIKLSHKLLSVAAGQSAAVSVTALDPKGLDGQRLPVWSGWIAVNGSDGSRVNLPYQGVTGSMREHQVLPPNGAMLSSRGVPVAERSTVSTNGSTDASYLGLMINATMGISHLLAELVPSAFGNGSAEAGKNAPDTRPVGQVYADSRYYGVDMNHVRLWAKGVPSAGVYKMVVRALRIFGNPDDSKDWDVSETPNFTINHDSIPHEAK